MKNSPEAARSVARGDLVMAACRKCSFIFNRAFDASAIIYNQHYDNTQSHSAFFDHYLDTRTDSLIKTPSIRDGRLVEVGCGKGDFLRKLIRHADSRNTGTGYDPSYRGATSEAGGRLEFSTAYYQPDASGPTPDALICRHVIEHIDQPDDFLCSILGTRPAHTEIFFETPDVRWSLRHAVFWDFFYEHCSLYNPVSLTALFRKHGFRDIAVETTFQQQYLWMAAFDRQPSNDAATAIAPDEIPVVDDLLRLVDDYAKAESGVMARWRTDIAHWSTVGPVALWGAGAKGATLAHMLDPDAASIDCLVDINPHKQGRFLAGTGHAIVSAETLALRGVRTAVVMNENYLDEIVQWRNARYPALRLVAQGLLC